MKEVIYLIIVYVILILAAVNKGIFTDDNYNRLTHSQKKFLGEGIPGLDILVVDPDWNRTSEIGLAVYQYTPSVGIAVFCVITFAALWRIATK